MLVTDVTDLIQFWHWMTSLILLDFVCGIEYILLPLYTRVFMHVDVLYSIQKPCKIKIVQHNKISNKINYAPFGSKTLRVCRSF